MSERMREFINGMNFTQYKSYNSSSSLKYFKTNSIKTAFKNVGIYLSDAVKKVEQDELAKRQNRNR